MRSDILGINLSFAVSECNSQSKLHLPAGRTRFGELPGPGVALGRAVENGQIPYLGDGKVWVVEDVEPGAGTLALGESELTADHQ